MEGRVKIPFKLPSLNDYIRAERTHRQIAAKMKRKVQDDIGWYINALPVFENPVIVDFEWLEMTKRRDLDNIDFAKKFILDAMVECGKIKDDSQKYVRALNNVVTIGDEAGVIVTVREI